MLSMVQRLLGFVLEFRLEELGYTVRDEPAGYDKDRIVWGDTPGDKSVTTE